MCEFEGKTIERLNRRKRDEVKLEEEERRNRRGEIQQDQVRSGCLGLCAMGSRQQIDYGAETLILCLSPISLP